MHRLTLILSDLYLPAEAFAGPGGRGAGFPALDLPHLDWLLRFSERVERVDDWRSWLSSELGGFDLARMTVAQACAQGSLPASLSANAWLATPVHLEARIDHVRLADRGLLRLNADERDTWRQDFARTFGPQFALHDAGERSFLLSGASAARVTSVDPARLLDADIGRALPMGPSAGELRRLGTEIEMWLHGAPANAARERRRERRVSALWLWGGGLREGGAGEAAPVTATRTDALATPRFSGGDPFLSALAGSPLNPSPASFAAIEGGEDRWVVEFAPMSGRKDESLTALESNWFAPAREALNNGTLHTVDLIANDRWFRIAARPGWRLWRRRSSWLGQLVRQVPDAMARLPL
jgi:hypothetical protein